MRKLRKVVSPTLTAALIVLQLAPGFLVPEKAQAVIVDGAPAIDVLGQYNPNSADGAFEDSYTHAGGNGGSNAFGLWLPYDSVIDTVGHRLFVADYNNNRVLVFNLNSSNQLVNRVADNVLGQPDFYTSTDAVTASGMTSPEGLAWDSANSRLFVMESDANRVLVFDLSSGITDGMAASNVLGQADFTSSGSGTTASTVSWPQGIDWDPTGSRLFVSDNYNSRVLVFDLATIADGEPAVNVLGQANFTSSTSGTTSIKLNYQTGVEWDDSNSRLFVADYWNNRVVVFDLATIADGEPAVNVLGQANFTSSSTATSSTGLYSPNKSVYDSDNSLLYVADSYNNRLIKYDVATLADGEPAVGVVGQADTFSSTFPPTPLDESYTRNSGNGGPFSFTSFVWPQGSLFDSANKRLFISDSNSRILVHDTDQYGTPLDFYPDYVIGQDDLTSADYGTASTLTNGPKGMEWDSTNSRLFVLDGGNQRVLVFDLSSGITNGMAASYVIGQTDFTSSSTGTTDSKFYYPYDISWDPTNSRLFVADGFNYRVLVFDLSSGITNGMAASYVLGQANFTSRSQATTQSGMKLVTGVDWDGDNSRLFVTDSYNRRVLAFDLSSGITNGMNASYVLGQAIFTSATQATTSAGMNSPRNAEWDGTNSRLFVSDYGNKRVTVFDLSSGITNGMAASYVLGQADFTSSTAAVTSTGLTGPISAEYLSSSNRLLVNDSDGHRFLYFDVSTATGTTAATTDNKVTLSRLAAGASADFSLSFDLAHVVSSTLTVTFPAGFTVTAAATSASSSSCLSDFSYTSSTLTANKTLCGGPITLGGATVTLPSTPGAYTITWVNDDPGSATVIIVSNDQITISATVAPTVSFLAVAQPAASTCANTTDLTGSDYTLALGTLNVATITESESLNADSSTVERICTQGSTNATSGMAVTVKNANGSSGLVSSSVSSDTIPSSVSGQLAAGTPGYGVCVRGSSLASDSGLTPTGADPTATGDFSTYECESASGNIVALTGTAQGLWSAAGPTQDATAAIWVRVAISAVQPAHNDYADSLTFVATATY